MNLIASHVTLDYPAIMLYLISWTKLGSAQSGSAQIKLDL